MSYVIKSIFPEIFSEIEGGNDVEKEKYLGAYKVSDSPGGGHRLSECNFVDNISDAVRYETEVDAAKIIANIYNDVRIQKMKTEDDGQMFGKDMSVVEYDVDDIKGTFTVTRVLSVEEDEVKMSTNDMKLIISSLKCRSLRTESDHKVAIYVIQPDHEIKKIANEMNAVNSLLLKLKELS